MEFESLLYDVADRVATITINRPERRNALSWTVMTELRGRLRRRPRPTRAVTSSCSPGRVTRPSRPAPTFGMRRGAGFVDLHDARGELARLFREVWELGKPTVARVRGYSLGRGLRVGARCATS